MFRFILMSCVFGVSLSALAEDKIYVCGQDVICEGIVNEGKDADVWVTDAQSKKPVTGIAILKYDNGQIRIKDQIKDGKLNGAGKEYYENGQLEVEFFFDGDYYGLQKEYYEDGTLRAEGNWKEGKYDGLWKSYYENGKLKDETYWKEGKKDGVRKTYYINGQLKEDGIWKEDKEDGPFKDYYENGQLYMEGEMKDNTPIGKLLVYYPNGWVKAEHSISEIDGISDGILKTYYDNGQLSEEEFVVVDFKTNRHGTIKRITYNKKGQKTEDDPETLDLLNDAVRQNDKEQIKAILKEHPTLHLDPPYVNMRVDKPLFLAARSSDTEILQLLLDHGADIEGLCSYEDTPLITALEYQKWDNARFLIENGADVNKANSFAISPLLGLAKGISEEPSDLFVLAMEHGGDIYKKNRVTACTIDERVDGECPEKYGPSVLEIIQEATEKPEEFLKDIPEEFQQNAKEFLQRQQKIKQYLLEKGYIRQQYLF